MSFAGEISTGKRHELEYGDLGADVVSTDIAALRRAVAAAPARMVLADALDEGGDAVAAALQRVLAERHDDRHRLNYASAVETSEPARAEFVRVQVELATAAHAKMPPYYDGSVRADCRSGCGACELERREARLFAGLLFRPDVIPAVLPRQLPLLNPRPTSNGALRRGFLEAVTCTAADWFAHGDAILAAHPVERVRLVTAPALRPVIKEAGAFRLPHHYAFWGECDVAGVVLRTDETLVPESRLATAYFPHDELRHVRYDIELRMQPSVMLPKRWPGVAFDLPV